MKAALRYFILTVIILLFMYFVYPTRYIYLNVPLQLTSRSFPVRVDRLTGYGEVLGSDGWIIQRRTQ